MNKKLTEIAKFGVVTITSFENCITITVCRGQGKYERGALTLKEAVNKLYNYLFK